MPSEPFRRPLLIYSSNIPIISAIWCEACWRSFSNSGLLPTSVRFSALSLLYRLLVAASVHAHGAMPSDYWACSLIQHFQSYKSPSSANIKSSAVIWSQTFFRLFSHSSVTSGRLLSKNIKSDNQSPIFEQ